MKVRSRGVAGVATLLVLIAAGSTPPASAQPTPLVGLDDYIEESMEAWDVPGLAISVIDGDSVVYARGFGVRDLETGEPVDPGTIFAIGSSSKAFTAAAVGMLVDQERVAWDDRAADHLPGFELADPYVTRELTVRDLLTHRSGLARGDLLWYAGRYDRDEILERVFHLEPSWSFRSTFGYQNIMYLAAGQIVEAVTDTTWDRFVDARIFVPLGMDRSGTTIRQLSADGNVAQPHAEIDGEIVKVPWRNIDNIAPAGSINSSVLEMARWVRLHLNEGTFRGERILSEDVVREMQTPQTLIRQEGPWRIMAPESHFFAYGMGWFLNDYRGRKVVHHGGNIDGMSALVAMLPEDDLGVVMLTNMNGSSLRSAIMYRIWDAYLGAPERDWSSEILSMVDSMEARAEAREEEMEEARVEGTSPSLEPGEYAGTYTDEMYGEVTVGRSGDGLVLGYAGAAEGGLEHWHHDTFRIEWGNPMLGRSFVTFHLNARGEPAVVEIEGLGRFERVPEAEAEDPGS